MTSYKEKKIFVYDIETISKQAIISNNTYSFGVSVHDDIIATAVPNVGISFINLMGKTLKILPNMISPLNYLHLKGDTLYISDFSNHILYCLSTHGEELWKFSSEKMKGPRGICTDTSGNVYVAACDSNTLMMISPDGTICKELLSLKDGISEPKSVYFDDLKRTLI